MGNTVCTDAVPFTLDDILLSQQKCPQLNIRDTLSTDILESFSQYQHNFKAFILRQDIVGNDIKRVDISQIRMLPFDLSQPKVKLEETAVYLLVHIQRTFVSDGTTNHNSFLSPSRYGDSILKGSDLARCNNEEIPSWARVVTDMFTPRGTSMAFATNIDQPLVPSTPTVSLSSVNGSGKVNAHGIDGCDFRYSVHIFTGVKAEQMMAFVAVLYATRIEQCLMKSYEVVQRLFFNYKPFNNLTEVKKENILCVPLGDIVSDRATHRSLGLSGEYARNAVLRILHHIRWKRLPPTVMSSTLSSRGNMPHEDMSTVRMNIANPITPFLFYKTLQKHQPVNISRSAGCQGPPVLEIPRLNFSTESSRQHTVEQSLNTLQFSSEQTPRTGQQHVSSLTSNSTSTRTPNVSGNLPSFPVISKLRLTEALNGRNIIQGAAENDEIRMTEERLQKLKMAAPQVTEVLPWLFVGGEEAARDRAQLLSRGITSIVNTVAFSLDNMHDDVFNYLGLYISDSPDEPIFSLFPVVNRFVEEARMKGGKTFIHCHQGVSRSCSFVIAYVMWYQGLCYDQAYEFVRVKRTVCSPNAGFYVNLLLWESHLSSPILNKAYAYVPYPQYLFPFSFRPALMFCKHRDSHDDEESPIVNSFMRTVYNGNDSYIVDMRLSYGILVGDRTPRSSGRVTPTFSFFFVGSECDAAIGQQAKEDWEAFMRYNFYHGQRKRSLNNKGDVITFTPLPALGQPTQCLGNMKELGKVIEERVFSEHRRLTSVSRYPKPILAYDSCWDVLLNHDDISSRFATYLVEERRFRVSSLNRKRLREEERRQLPKLIATGVTPRVSPHVCGSLNTPASTSGVVVSERTLSSSVTPTSAGQLNSLASLKTPVGVVAASAVTAALPRKGLSLTPSTSRSNVTNYEVEIYEYPFYGSPLSNILDVSDMEAERCYAIIVPSTAVAATTSKQHHVFLWFGCGCSVSEEEAWQAYQRTLKAGEDVRLWNGALLKSPQVEIVHDGGEPDDLILALES